MKTDKLAVDNCSTGYKTSPQAILWNVSRERRVSATPWLCNAAESCVSGRSLLCAQGSIAEPGPALKVGMLYHVSNGKREISPAQSVSAWRFEPPASAACWCIRTSNASGWHFCVRWPSADSTAWAGKKHADVCVRRHGGSNDLDVHQIWKALITSFLLRVIYN